MEEIKKINDLLQICFDKSETFSHADKTSDIDKDIRDIIKNNIPHLLKIYLGNPKYIVKGSVGAGRATKSPWIAILDSDLTDTTQHGIYIIFIFSSDYKHLYLTLNQGTTSPEYFGSRIRRKEIRQKKTEVQQLLNKHHSDLKTDGRVNISDLRYQEGIIYYTIWDTSNLTKCQSNLNLYLDTYQQYKEIINNKIRISNPINILPKFFPYLTALRTKPFMLLAGISGTGKSRIVREMAKACWKEGDEEYGKNYPRNFCMVQVKPNWHDSTELMGYVTRISGKPEYVAGDFVKFVVKAWYNEEMPYFLCLDEMNLAPVEQYFAEYLSVIESRKMDSAGIITTDPLLKAAYHRNEDGTKEPDEWYVNLIDNLLVECPNEKLFAVRKQLLEEGISIPQNLFVVGTVNMDETTFSFSRKVLDRAMTIEMNEVDLHGGLTKTDGNEIGYIGNSIIGDAAEGCDVYEENKELCDSVLAYLEEVNKALDNTPFKIAYRTRNEFLMYAINRKALAPDSQLWQTLDEMTSMKILSRIEGDSDRTKHPLEELKKIVDKYIVVNIPLAEESKQQQKSVSEAKIDEMLKKLQSTSFTSYWT